jgi:hypothetical protein
VTYPQPQAQPKYTNRDVEADFARLHAIARKYLATYSGTFEVLRAAKAVVARGDLLGVEQLRMVCNTIKYDFHVHNMPEPQGHLHTFDAGDVEYDADVVDIHTRRPVVTKSE